MDSKLVQICTGYCRRYHHGKRNHACSLVTNDQFTKIREQLQQAPPNIKKALKYVEDDVEYSSCLKRKYDDLAEADDKDLPSPMKEPSELLSINHKLNESSSSNSSALIVKFVDNFKEENPGIM